MTTELPLYKQTPTGPMSRILRRMHAGGVLTAVTHQDRQDRPRVVCLLGGHEVDRRLVAGLVTRGLIEETETDDGSSTYGLTADGAFWATDTNTNEG